MKYIVFILFFACASQGASSQSIDTVLYSKGSLVCISKDAPAFIDRHGRGVNWDIYIDSVDSKQDDTCININLLMGKLFLIPSWQVEYNENNWQQTLVQNILFSYIDSLNSNVAMTVGCDINVKNINAMIFFKKVTLSMREYCEERRGLSLICLTSENKDQMITVAKPFLCLPIGW